MKIETLLRIGELALASSQIKDSRMLMMIQAIKDKLRLIKANKELAKTYNKEFLRGLSEK